MIKRAETWYPRRRPPRQFEQIEARRNIWISLHRDSETLARAKAAVVWMEQLNGWEARLAGDTADGSVAQTS